MKPWTILPAVFLSIMGPARAEPGPTVSWLMNTPATLFDRGMDSMRQDIASTVRYLTLPVGAKSASPWVVYDWEKNEITMRIVLVGMTEKLPYEACAKYRKEAENLTYFAAFSEDAESKSRSISDYIERQFSHVGFQETGRPKDLGKNLSTIVFLEVAAYSSKSKESVVCRGRLGEDPSFKTTK